MENLYNGIPKIIFNRARCRKCGTFLESKSVHDFQTCSCGAISIDGGKQYLRRVGDFDAIEDLSEIAKPIYDENAQQ